MGNSKSIQRGLALLLLGSISIITTGCTKFGTADAPGEAYAETFAAAFQNEKIQLHLPTLEQQDPNFTQANSRLAFKMSSQDGSDLADLVLPKGTRLVAMLDHTCLDSSPMPVDQSGISHALLGSEPRVNGLRLQAYSIELKENTTVAQLNEQAELNRCWVAVSNDGTLEASALMPPNDPRYPSQVYMPTLNALEGWDKLGIDQGGIRQKTIVAVIDTGVDYRHEDLSGSMWRNSQGQVGYDFVNKDSDPLDDQYHGTHVTGFIGATMGNRVGVSGVSGNTAQIMAIKAMDADGKGSLANVINGINFAVENGAKVINLSLGGPQTSPAYKQAIDSAVQAGVLVVTAAGNDGQTLGSGLLQYPAVYAKDIAGLIAVGALDVQTGDRSSFSNYSSTYLEIMAPGSNSGRASGGILSTYTENRYAYLSGTSMATPIVAGAAAMAWSVIHSRGYQPSPSDIERIITEGARQESKLQTFVKDGRALDLSRMADRINSQYPVVAPTPTPTATPTPTPPPTATPAPAPSYLTCEVTRDPVTGAARKVCRIRWESIRKIWSDSSRTSI